ncbi:MAG TPA: ABC transporter ATP-binding protein [Acidimicrobiales bacterium]|nr:ABC transporter ATP-binding protein [Acidimicrobiales bacterium]
MSDRGVGGGNGLVERVRRSPRTKAIRLLWQTSRPLSFLLALDVVLLTALPLAVLVSMGAMVSRLPEAVVDGWSSPAGDRLTTSLVLVAIAFLASMLSTPFHEWLAAAIKIRLTYATQARLMSAVSRPVGIAHLEDPAVLDRVALAQGNLMSWFPADAPAVLAVVLSYRLTWLAGCVIVGTFRWYLGIALLVVWQWSRQPIVKVIKEHVAAFGGNAAVMRRADYFHQLATKPSAAKELRVFGLGPWVVARYREHWLTAMQDVYAIRAGMTKTVAGIGIGILATYTLTCALIAQAALDGDITIGRVAILLPVLFLTMSNGCVTFDDLGLEWQLSGLPELDGLEDDLASREARLGGGTSPDGMPATAIRFEQVGFRYPGAATDVFDGLDLELRAGTSTAIVGANGAGKTTLVKLLARLHDPTAGRITVDGTPLHELDAEAWQRKVAVVFQDFSQLPLTAAENIGLGAHEHLADREGIVVAAERAGIRGAIEALPAGWDTPLTRQLSGGADLSGGQWQRIALARALFAARHGASVLVLDEPTSWLDVRGEADFFERFLEITEGLTTIVISHRFSTVRLADRICVVREGRVAETGSHAELVDQNGLYARMFRLQAARFAEAEVTE